MFSQIALLALLVALGSCAEINGTQPPPVPSDLSSYFWPAQSATYHYRESDSTLRAVSISAAGTRFLISDIGTNGTDYVADAIGSSIQLSDLKPGQLFPLPAGYVLVKDTNGTPSNPIKPTALLTVRVSPGKSVTLVLAGDSCYALTSSNTLEALSALPGSGYTYLIGNGGLLDPIVAISSDGRVAVSTDVGNSWLSLRNAPSGIVGAATNEDLCVATATEVYKFDDPNKPWKRVFSVTAPARITTLAPAGNKDYIIGTDQGEVIRPDGGGPMNGKPLPTLSTVMALCEEGNGDVLAASGNIVYEFDKGIWKQRSSFSAKVVSLLSEGFAQFYYATEAGEVGILGGSRRATLPAGVKAFNVNGSDLIAIAGEALYVIDASGQFSAVPVTMPGTHLQPGTLTLLKNGDTTWIAGALAQERPGDRPAYVYVAHVIESGVQLQIGESLYDNILVVHYTPTSERGPVDPSIPEYTVYYQKGQGPVRVESIGGGPPRTSTRTAN